MTISFTKSFAFAALAGSLLFASCKADTTPVTPVTKTYGNIMVFHGAVDAPAVDFSINGSKANSDSIAYSKGTAYAQTELTTGKKTVFAVTASKTGAAISTDSLAMNSIDAGIAYSVFVYQDKDAAKTVRTIYGPDNLLAPAAGKGKIRLVQLIPDLNVNVDVEAVVAGGVASSASTYPNLAFPQISDYVELAKGTYDFKIKISGTTQVLATVPGIIIEDGKIYTVVARGLANAVAPRGMNATLITNK